MSCGKNLESAVQVGLLPVVLVAVGGAVEAVGADALLGQTDGGNKVFDGGELDTGEAQAAGYLVDHALVFGRARLGVTLQVLLVVALDVLDDAARDQLQV